MRMKRRTSGLLTFTTLGHLDAWLRRRGHRTAAQIVAMIDESPVGRLIP